MTKSFPITTQHFDFHLNQYLTTSISDHCQAIKQTSQQGNNARDLHLFPDLSNLGHIFSPMNASACRKPLKFMFPAYKAVALHAVTKQKALQAGKDPLANAETPSEIC